MLHLLLFQCLDLLTYVSTAHFSNPNSMDSLFTFLISFSSMSFFLLSCLRSEGSQCHMQWLPKLSSGFPAHFLQGSTGILLLLSFCWVCIYFLFFFFYDSNYFKHNTSFSVLRVLNVVQNTKAAV